MRRCSFFAALLLCVCFSVPTFAQSTYATVSGTVEDTSRALASRCIGDGDEQRHWRGTTPSATNPALTIFPASCREPTRCRRSYQVSRRTYTNVQLGNAQQVRLNFTLQVTTQSQSVEVSVAADTAIATSSASIGEVLSQQKVTDLPIVGNNILSFLTLMPGVRMNDDGVTGTFAGLSADKINVQRDGVDASASARYVQAGAQTATFVESRPGRRSARDHRARRRRIGPRQRTGSVPDPVRNESVSWRRGVVCAKHGAGCQYLDQQQAGRFQDRGMETDNAGLDQPASADGEHWRSNQSRTRRSSSRCTTSTSSEPAPRKIPSC